MVVIVGIAGWFVARRSLAPIGAMTAVAAEIARSGRLSMRLGMESSDELGRLSQTFDTMLAQLEASFSRERGFIGSVCHELRNAIGTIAAEAELAVSRPRNEDAYRGGLGLSIAAAIATSFGGRISVDDGSADGACFRVELPIAVEAVPMDVPPSSLG